MVSEKNVSYIWGQGEIKNTLKENKRPLVAVVTYLRGRNCTLPKKMLATSEGILGFHRTLVEKGCRR